MNHHIIYIPGIGDTKTAVQELVVKTWRLWGVVPHTFPMRWADGEAFEPKFQRLLAYVDELLAAGNKVSLVGASAGASVVLNAFPARPAIHGVVCIAGKVNHPEAIGARYRRKTPAFVESAYEVKASLERLSPAQRARISSRFGLTDAIVPRRDSIIPGAQNRAGVSFGHFMTIAAQLTFGAPSWIFFLKSLR